MHKNYLSSSWKYNIWCPGQISNMQAIAIASSKKLFAYYKLGSGVLSSDK